MTWVTEYAEGLDFLANRDGVSWADAPVPPRRHGCTPQTRGSFGGMLGREIVERCACGGIRASSDPVWPTWMDRNSRKPDQPRRPWWRRMLGGTR